MKRSKRLFKSYSRQNIADVHYLQERLNSRLSLFLRENTHNRKEGIYLTSISLCFDTHKTEGTTGSDKSSLTPTALFYKFFCSPKIFKDCQPPGTNPIIQQLVYIIEIPYPLTSICRFDSPRTRIQHILCPEMSLTLRQDANSHPESLIFVHRNYLRDGKQRLESS